MTVNWDLLQVVVGIPAVLGALAYCAPQARLRRKIKAFGETAAALPDGELRDWYSARAARHAAQLRLYREEIVETWSYPLNWFAAALVIPWWFSLLKGGPSAFSEQWRSQPVAVSFGFLFTLGVVSFLSGFTDAFGQHPLAKRAEAQEMLTQERARRARRTASLPARAERRRRREAKLLAPWHAVRARWISTKYRGV